MGKVKQELQRMEQLGVISQIEQPTEWCSGMVVAPKKSKDEIRICVDLSPPNEAVCREKFILPSVDQTLGMLSGAKIFKVRHQHGVLADPADKKLCPLHYLHYPIRTLLLQPPTIWHCLSPGTLSEPDGKSD